MPVLNRAGRHRELCICASVFGSLCISRVAICRKLHLQTSMRLMWPLMISCQPAVTNMWHWGEAIVEYTVSRAVKWSGGHLFKWYKCHCALCSHSLCNPPHFLCFCLQWMCPPIQYWVTIQDLCSLLKDMVTIKKSQNALPLPFFFKITEAGTHSGRSFYNDPVYDVSDFHSILIF